MKTPNYKDVGHFPLTKCLYLQYVPRVPGMSPGPHFQTKNGLIGSTFRGPKTYSVGALKQKINK